MTNVDADPEKYRARQSVPGDYLQTLLNSLTLDHIRDAIYSLAENAKISLKNHAGSRDAILKTHKPVEKIVRTLLSVESASPFKHCLFFKCTNVPSLSSIEASRGKSQTSNAIDFRVAHIVESESTFLITFEHYVDVQEWIETAVQTKTLETTSTRHPIVFRLVKRSQIGSLSYPGFSQGSGTKREKLIDYQQLLTGVLRMVDELGFSSKVISVKNAIKTFLSGENSKVHRLRTEVETAGLGRFDLSSDSQGRTAEQSLADLLQPYIKSSSKNELVDATRKALNESDTNFIVLFWTQEKVITRLRFWDIGCELLFIWHGEHSDYRIVDGIIEVLAGAHERLGEWIGASPNVPFNWIAAQLPGTVSRPSELASICQRLTR